MVESVRVAVIGAGISGLAAAHRLRELHPTMRVRVFEAGQRCGGVIATEHVDGFHIELGPDSLLRTLPWGMDLMRRLGIADELLGTNPAERQTWILRAGQLQALPEGLAIMAPRRLWPTLRSPVLSVRGKVRLAQEWFVPPRAETSDESLAGFACRRFGREAFERLIQPLVSGIYMADPQKLSMRAALPRFVEMEAQHGSLIRAARRTMSARRTAGADRSASADEGLFVAPREGLGRLITALVEQLPEDAIRLRTPVEQLSREADGRWRVVIGGDAQEEDEAFEGVIVATPSGSAARMLSGVDPGVADDLARIEHSGCVVVSLAYAREDVGHPLDGYGFVVPHVEHRDLIACTFSSTKYTHRAPAGQVLLRVFLGGATRPEMLALDDDVLLEIVERELNPLLGIRARPPLTRVTRWPGVMPQYHVGHLDLIAGIEAKVAELPGIELAGNSYRGVGISHCIHSGEQAAERLISFLRESRRPTSITGHFREHLSSR